VTTLDESNIDQVNEALERHQTSIRRRPPSHLSAASSDNITDEDYDYRLDVDPPNHPLEEVGSHPSQREEGEEMNLHMILDSGINEHISGEYIPMGETDGLPTVPQGPKEDELGAAKDLVRAHTGKWGVLRRRVRGAGAVGRAFGTPTRENGPSGGSGGQSQTNEKGTPAQEAFAARYPEADSHDTGTHMGGMPGGASVLSSLLALYGQQGGMHSGTTSAASSRPTSDDEASDEEVEQHRRSHDAERHRGRSSWFGGRRPTSTSDDTSVSNTPGDVIIRDETRRPSHTGDEHPLTHHRSKSTSSLADRPPPSPGLAGMISRAKQQYKERERPKAARSGAGVFGALIQNTQNISGVATPAASSLAPAADKPGFSLTRYAVEAPGSESTPNTPWRPISRPSSRAGSRPGSVHSSTAVSANGDSPSTKDDSFSIKKAVSTDDMLTLRSDNAGRKRAKPNLKLDSLGRLPASVLKESGHALKEGGQALKNAEKWILSAGKTPLTTPPADKMGTDGFFPRVMTEDERRRKEWEAEKKRRKKAKEARKKKEIFVSAISRRRVLLYRAVPLTSSQIIQHVAAILARQQFLMKLARALMM
jgi:hypothetical protein